jgi:NAD(P)-dependent dehydrogenase (short-subunit alcohol dehydrogenase family)
MTTNIARFDGKIALVTGGASGMGRAAARRFLDEGAQVVIAGRSEERLREAAEALGAGDRLLTVSADVTKIADLERLAAATRSRFGHLDVVFANAGTAVFKHVEEFTEADFDHVVNANLKGVYFTVQKLLPLLREGGSIVINASWTHNRGFATGSVYAATKAAAVNLTRTLAADLAERGIRVNAVSPGYIATEMFHAAVTSPEEIEAVRTRVPVRRIGTSEEVAAVVAFLASDEAAYVNAADLLVDGGLANTTIL